jgi:Site-specific recombinase XerD
METNIIKDFLELKSSNTAKAYERDIKDFFKTSSIEEVTLNDIKKVTSRTAEKYLKELNGRGIASSTINRKMSAVSSLFAWLLKHKEIDTNPFVSVKEEKPKTTNKETEFLTVTETETLLNSFNPTVLVELRNKALLSLAFTTALRKSELINIKLSNIKERGEFHVIEVTRKGGKKDIVKVQPQVLSLIKEYLSRTNRTLNSECDSYLFVGHSNNHQNGEKLSSPALNKMIKTACHKVGITKNITVHSARHTAITLAIQGGATIEKVRDFASHSSIVTTNRYVHSVNKIEDNASDFIQLNVVQGFVSQGIKNLIESVNPKGVGGVVAC